MSSSNAWWRWVPSAERSSESHAWNAVVAAARVVVCGDTGVAHLATAYRRPSVVLFGPVSPALWGPPVRPGREGPLHVVLWHGDGTGNPWGTELDPALQQITVDEVIGALDAVPAEA